MQRGPVVLSLKTSIRERYKQAEFEAQAMKDVHRRAKNFLVTMEKDEAISLQTKIDSGVLSGIDGVVVANEKSFDELIKLLKSLSIVDTPVFSAIKNPQKIEFREDFVWDIYLAQIQKTDYSLDSNIWMLNNQLNYPENKYEESRKIIEF